MATYDLQGSASDCACLATSKRRSGQVTPGGASLPEINQMLQSHSSR